MLSYDQYRTLDFSCTFNIISQSGNILAQMYGKQWSRCFWSFLLVVNLIFIQFTVNCLEKPKRNFFSELYFHITRFHPPDHWKNLNQDNWVLAGQKYEYLEEKYILPASNFHKAQWNNDETQAFQYSPIHKLKSKKKWKKKFIVWTF